MVVILMPTVQDYRPMPLPDKRPPVNRALTPGFGRPENEAKPHILVVDDERVMRDLLEKSLLRLGYDVTAVENGEKALDLLEITRFDLVMLDVVMPGMDGFEVCRELRRHSDVPVVMLTALNRPDDIVLGLELGADNYITKPFHFKEVEAQIRAILRRTAHISDRNVFDVAEYGDLKLNNTTREVFIAGKLVELTQTEFSLLQHLTARADRPVKKEEMLQEVWGYTDADNANLVELAIRRLRTKIETDASSPVRLVTVRGIGYKFVTQQQSRTVGRSLPE